MITNFNLYDPDSFLLLIVHVRCVYPSMIKWREQGKKHPRPEGRSVGGTFSPCPGVYSPHHEVPQQAQAQGKQEVSRWTVCCVSQCVLVHYVLPPSQRSASRTCVGACARKQLRSLHQSPGNAPFLLTSLLPIAPCRWMVQSHKSLRPRIFSLGAGCINEAGRAAF